MLKYIPISFVTIVCWSLATITQNGVTRYSVIGDLESAERLLGAMWLFTLASLLMFATLALMLVFDLRRKSAYPMEVCSSECDKKCADNNHYEWNN
jgi:hypothetical protein